MRIAIISDIHGNYEALLSVNEDIQKSKVDKIISLGDQLGYAINHLGCCELSS